MKADLRAKGLSRKRVNNILACLGKMLRYAHEIELLEIVPGVKLLKVPQQRIGSIRVQTTDPDSSGPNYGVGNLPALR